MERVLICGGSGFIGQRLAEKLEQMKKSVWIATRSPENFEGSFGKPVAWNPDGSKDSKLLQAIKENKIDCLVNLAGDNIAEGRWTNDKKKRLVNSRIQSTQTIVKSLQELAKEEIPSVVLQASAIGYYGDDHRENLDEKASAGTDFLAKLCIDWEEAAKPIEEVEETRLVILRIGVVLDRNDGAFQQMVQPFKFGAGGQLGDGSQGMSWIHSHDLVAMMVWMAQNDSCKGVYNATAPEPVTNKQFTKALGKVMRKPSFFRVPGVILEYALGEFANFLLHGPTVVPKKALKEGFEFRYPTLSRALFALVSTYAPPAYIHEDLFKE
jgi:hypothetical protein